MNTEVNNIIANIFEILEEESNIAIKYDVVNHKKGTPNTPDYNIISVNNCTTVEQFQIKIESICKSVLKKIDYHLCFLPYPEQCKFLSLCSDKFYGFKSISEQSWRKLLFRNHDNINYIFSNPTFKGKTKVKPKNILQLQIVTNIFAEKWNDIIDDYFVKINNINDIISKPEIYTSLLNLLLNTGQQSGLNKFNKSIFYEFCKLYSNPYNNNYSIEDFYSKQIYFIERLKIEIHENLSDKTFDIFSKSQYLKMLKFELYNSELQKSDINIILDNLKEHIDKYCYDFNTVCYPDLFDSFGNDLIDILKISYKKIKKESSITNYDEIYFKFYFYILYTSIKEILNFIEEKETDLSIHLLKNSKQTSIKKETLIKTDNRSAPVFALFLYFLNECEYEAITTNIKDIEKACNKHKYDGSPKNIRKYFSACNKGIADDPFNNIKNLITVITLLNESLIYPKSERLAVKELYDLHNKLNFQKEV